MLRVLVATWLGLVASIFTFVAARGVIGSWPLAAAVAAVAMVGVGVGFHRRSPLVIDEAACPRALCMVAALAAVLALVALGRQAVFMVDATRVSFSGVPSSAWEAQHSCLSAYYVAAKAASTTPNVYADSLYTRPDDDPRGIRKARMLGPFKIDVFEYPPPFLLLPRALRWVTPDFDRMRMLWFGLSGLVMLAATLVAARFLGPAAGTRAILLSPLLWMSTPTISTLQKGNIQILVIAASVVAMALFERRRWAAGGALLAFVTVSKLYPGLLVVYLIARRQWRAVAWTAAASLAFVVAAWIDLGPAAYAAFLDHLPGLLGGEAFPAFRNPAAMAINFSVPGLVFKLKLFGVPGMTFAVSKLVAWIYTALAVAAIVWVARRPLRDDEKPAVWLSILILATLRSPFLPQAYAALPPLWLVTLLAAIAMPTVRALSLTLLAWAGLNVFWPLDWPIDPRVLAVMNGIPQALAIAVPALALRRGEPASSSLPWGRSHARPVLVSPES